MSEIDARSDKWGIDKVNPTAWVEQGRYYFEGFNILTESKRHFKIFMEIFFFFLSLYKQYNKTI